MLDCHWKKHFGIECFGCGFQRSIELLFEGNFLDSLAMFPATIPLLLTFGYTAAHLLFKYKNGAKMIIILFSISASLMLGNFIWKLL